MAHSPSFSDAFVGAMLNAGLQLLNGGVLDVYDGVRPADTSVAITTQVRLARCPFASPAFPYPTAGVAVSFALTSDADTVGGTASWCRVSDSALNAQVDGSVGLADADLILNTLTLLTHGTLDLPSVTFTQPKG